MSPEQVLASDRRWWSTAEVARKLNVETIDASFQLHRLAQAGKVGSMHTRDGRWLWGSRR
jgi:hypothetical protein